MKVIMFFFLVLLPVTGTSQTEIPQAEISNKLIQAKLYLTDASSGYYRGTRFDWSGVIKELEYQGHSYFGQWFEVYDPVLHDAIMGPVEEFTPVGYDEANEGESFIKIGVGALKKPSEAKYDRTMYYEIENSGTWRVRKRNDHVRFTQVLKHGDYSYKYVKTIRLQKGKPVMEIDHSLVNRGDLKIEASVYNHNFFVIDTTKIGADYVIIVPFEIEFDEMRVSQLAEIRNNQITFRRNLITGETVRMGTILGFSDDQKDYDIRIENQRTGAGVRITGDRPLSKILFWAMPKTLTPEPFIDISVQPGKEFRWRINYEFYTISGSE